MSDRTQGSVRTEGRGQAGGAPSDDGSRTAAIPTDRSGDQDAAGAPKVPAGGTSPAKAAPATADEPAGPRTPAAAPGWGGATPAKAAGPATSQEPAARPAGNPPARPAAPAATGSRPPAKGDQPARPAQRPAATATAAAAGATVGATRSGAPQTGARPANRDSAGAPRQAAGRPPAGGSGSRPTGQPVRTGTPEPEGDAERSTGRGGKASRRGPRRARLQLRNIDTWSALKISLVLAIALFFVWMVAVGVLYGVLNGLGVFTTVNDLVGQLGSVGGDAGEVITPGIVFGGAAVIGAVNIVLFTALCTVGTFVYNLCSDLVGGLEVTLSERD